MRNLTNKKDLSATNNLRSVAVVFYSCPSVSVVMRWCPVPQQPRKHRSDC
jgi:hypothetical protein